MTRLRKNKKFRIGLVFVLFLFVFLSIAHKTLAQGDLEGAWEVSGVSNDLTDLQRARSNLTTARVMNFLDVFNPISALHTIGNAIPFIDPLLGDEYMSDAQRNLINAQASYGAQVSLEAARARNVSAEQMANLERVTTENVQQTEALTKETQDNINSQNVPIGEIIARMFAWLLYYIAVGLGWILMLITSVMLKIATYNNFLREGMVQSGWRIVRDICNNFFIILLLITAISTMLRQGEFKDWRGMLPKILVAAVVINFSLLMCGIFIDVSQIFTLTFASPLNTVPGYNVILAAMGIPSGMQLSKLLTAKENSLETTARVDTIDLIAALFYAIITTFVTMVVIVAVTVILAYRIVWLWFLIILSPLPILLAIFKKGASYASQWWSEFTKYLIVGPVVMFFLYLSFMAMGQMDNTGYSGNSSNILNVNTGEWSGEATIGNNSQVNLTSGSDTVSLSNAASPDGLINFLIIIGLMVGSLIMAQKMGVGGSKFAGQSLGWLQKQGKRWSGFNLGKSALTTAAKAPGAIATAADDKIGLRQGLYGAAFAAGGKFIPFAGQALGKKIDELETGTQKRTSVKYGDLAKGYKVDDMNEAELRKLAAKGGARSVVAARELMKKGLIRDDDKENWKANVEMIRKARKALDDTDLGDVFDETMKKRNPALALQSVYLDKAGKLDESKIKEDVKNGKLDFGDVLDAVDSNNIENVRKLMGGNSNEALKFMDNLFGGDYKKISSAIGKIEDDKVRDALFGNVDATQIKAMAMKDEIDPNTGRFIIDPTTGRPNQVADYKKLDNILSALLNNGVNPGKTSDFYSDDEVGRSEHAKVINKNVDNLKEMHEKELREATAQLNAAGGVGSTSPEAIAAQARIDKSKAEIGSIFEKIGDVISKDVITKLRSSHTDLKNAVNGLFNEDLARRAQKIDSLPAGTPDHKKEVDRMKDFLERGVVGGAKLDLPTSLSGVSATTRNLIGGKMGEFSVEELDKAKFQGSYNEAPAQLMVEMIWDKSQPSTILNIFKEGKNSKLKKALTQYITNKYPNRIPPNPSTAPEERAKYDLIQQYL